MNKSTENIAHDYTNSSKPSDPIGTEMASLRQRLAAAEAQIKLLRKVGGEYAEHTCNWDCTDDDGVCKYLAALVDAVNGCGGSVKTIPKEPK